MGDKKWVGSEQVQRNERALYGNWTGWESVGLTTVMSRQTDWGKSFQGTVGNWEETFESSKGSKKYEMGGGNSKEGGIYVKRRLIKDAKEVPKK